VAYKEIYVTGSSWYCQKRVFLLKYEVSTANAGVEIRGGGRLGLLFFSEMPWTPFKSFALSFCILLLKSLWTTIQHIW